MATIDVLNTTGEKVAQAELADEIFAVTVKPSVIHQVVTAQLAARRAGSAAVKRRSDVKGSTRKLYRQKGTGRARKGDIKSPLLRGGGVVFGPSPRSFDKKVPKKVRKLALKMALSSKLQGGELLVIDNMEMERIKTKDFVEIINALDADNALIITSATNENLERSSRNVPNIKVMRTEGLNVYDILKHRKLVLLKGSIEGIEGRLLQ
jgi:large subunit ribosomal protein L4